MRLPQLAAATVNCRVLPEDSPEYVLSTLQKVVADDQVSVKQLSDFSKAAASPMRPDVLKAVSDITSPHVARRPDGPHHGHGRDRRPLSSRRGHSHVWRPGLLHGSR